MASIVVAGDTSGTITLAAPAVAGTTTLTLPTTSGTVDAFPSGTKLLFQQTAAPTGWTKSTSHDNKALRVVSSTASSGGSVAFTTAFASQAVSGTVGSTTLTTSQVPNATGGFAWHGGEAGSSAWLPNGVFGGSSIYAPGYRAPGSPSGGANSMGGVTLDLGFGNGSHNHSFSGTAINLAVQYVDVIIATKD
jgi:hypothetical protein